MTLSPMRTMPQSRTTRLRNELINIRYRHEFESIRVPAVFILKIRVKVISQRNVAAIVDVQRGLDEDTFADLAEVLLEQIFPISGERVRGGIIWEVVVVFVHKLSCTEATIHQFGSQGVVSDLIPSATSFENKTVNLRAVMTVQDSRDHFLVVITPRGVCQSLCIFNGGSIFLRVCRHFDG